MFSGTGPWFPVCISETFTKNNYVIPLDLKGVSYTATFIGYGDDILRLLCMYFPGYYVYINRHLAYERVYLPLCKVADTPFHI